MIDEGLGHWNDGWYRLDGGTTDLNGASSTLAGNLYGYEFHGVLRFEGTFTELEWTNEPGEYWHGFTMGVQDPASIVPEPATLTLMGSGLLALAVGYRRRKESLHT